MKRTFLMVAFVTFAFVSTLTPVRSAPPVLLSAAGGVSWNCSRSAFIVTTCAPHRDLGGTYAKRGAF